MKISNKWLKDYIKYDLEPDNISALLTDIGLEVELLEHIETVKGGLKGVLVGEVLTCHKHPDADKLSITTVSIGEQTPLQIVCGASNVAAGQKVAVATIGTTLYNNEEPFQIKKSKIRGVVSEGMICAEDELGLGVSHSGIMVLNENAKAGTPAKQYFNIEDDIVFEIGLTPNRTDATSHYGVARDLAAVLNCRNNAELKLIRPNIENFEPDETSSDIKIEIIDKTNCPRYTGLHIKNIKVSESPSWLQNKLQSIGIRPINNIVDITNFVMFEIGQPLHAFDSKQIVGNKVVIKTAAPKTKFTTLDGIERELNGTELMICNQKEEMCIAGVYGGLRSGVNEKTTEIFLESAYFNPVSIRKTSKLHNLKTDSSFRFERGCDADITIYAIKRAALLIKEIAGGVICSNIIDEYPQIIKNPIVEVNYQNIYNLIGKEIAKESIKNILQSLEIEVLEQNNEKIILKIPLFKADVTRECDVIEEILRIYGYNNIETSNKINYSYIPTENSFNLKLQNKISDFLSANSFVEAMNNSLSKFEYFEKFDILDKEKTVNILNPLSKELNTMRQNLLFGLLENINLNINYKNNNIRIYEFGNIYFYNKDFVNEDVRKKYTEKLSLGIAITGKAKPEMWLKNSFENNFFELKNITNNILQKCALTIDDFSQIQFENSLFSNALSLEFNNNEIIKLGCINQSILKHFDIKQDVFYCEIDFDKLSKLSSNRKTKFKPINNFPSVRRDLALLVDKKITFLEIKNLALKTEKKLIKSISLFDVYEGEKIDSDKKSYAIKVSLQHNEKTLNDFEINSIMDKLIKAFEKELSAVIR